MKVKCFMVALVFWTTISAKYQTPINKNKDSLVLVHVLFRHGNRTANGPEELYPNDPYVNETYYPFGLGQLTNAGKQKEFCLGKALRNRYDKFLGKYHYPDIVDARSTDYNRTKMSLELVLAGLFPPTGVSNWQNHLPWLPIPYNYWPAARDAVLQGTVCPHYMQLYQKQTESSKQQAEYAKYEQLFEYITLHSGRNITSFQDVYNLNFGLDTEAEWGFKLPEWTKSVWPTTMATVAAKEYFVATATDEMKSMAIGYFLQKIIADTRAKIAASDSAQIGRKIYLYSAHENNVAELLLTMGVFYPPHIPTYGSYVTLEVHQINGVYGIRILYENYKGKAPQILTIPQCETFCPLDKFAILMENYLPRDNLCNYEENVIDNNI